MKIFKYKEMASTKECRDAHLSILDMCVNEIAEGGLTTEEKAKLLEIYRDISRENREFEIGDSEFNYNIGVSHGKIIGALEGAACVICGYFLGGIIGILIKK